MKKNKILAITLLATLLFSSCVPKQQPNSNPVSTTSEDGIVKPVSTSSEKTTLTILNWADYLEENVIDDFEKEYPNIKVYYETMTSNEEMLVQLENPNSAYDICFPSDYTIAKLQKKGLLQEIDKTKLPHSVNIDEKFMNLEFDPQNKYSLPYLWGTVGILYNKTMVTQEEVQSWNVLWNEKYKKQIFMYDSVRDTIGVALRKNKSSINTTDLSLLAAAEKELVEQKKLVLAYGTDDLRDKMISGSGAMAVVYSGDALYSTKENPDLDYFVPMEGSNIWFDNVVLLKSSKNVEAAHLFIDFLMRSDIAKRNTEYIGYSTPNKAALEKSESEFKENPIYNPSDEVIKRCESFVDLGETMKDYNDAWLRIKAAQ